MADVTQILQRIELGDPSAAEQLLPLIYDELRNLAAQKLRHEKPGQTLQATALVHESYLRLVDGAESQHWNGRGHFFAAAAEAMRRSRRSDRQHPVRMGNGSALGLTFGFGIDIIGGTGATTPNENTSVFVSRQTIEV